MLVPPVIILEVHACGLNNKIQKTLHNNLHRMWGKSDTFILSWSDWQALNNPSTSSVLFKELFLSILSWLEKQHIYACKCWRMDFRNTVWGRDEKFSHLELQISIFCNNQQSNRIDSWLCWVLYILYQCSWINLCNCAMGFRNELRKSCTNKLRIKITSITGYEKYVRLFMSLSCVIAMSRLFKRNWGKNYHQIYII